MRTASIRRDTAETRIALTLTLEGDEASGIDTGCGFLDHMLELFARHGAVRVDSLQRGLKRRRAGD